MSETGDDCVESRNTEKSPFVYVIILNYDGLEYTKRCLESLRLANYANFEILIVDNGSKQPEGEILKELFPNVISTIRLENNAGFAQGNNVAIRYAFNEGAEYFFLLNNDTIVTPDTLRELVVFADTNPRIGIVGPKVLKLLDGRRTSVIQSFGGKVNLFLGETPLIGGEMEHRQFKQPHLVDYVSGCAMLIKRNVVKDLGLLDPRYFMYVEDVDYCVRAKKLGFQIWSVPSARIWHKGETSAPNILRLYYRISSLIIFERIHAPKLGLISFLFFLTFVKIPLLSIKSFFRKPLDTFTMVIRSIQRGFSKA